MFFPCFATGPRLECLCPMMAKTSPTRRANSGTVDSHVLTDLAVIGPVPLFMHLASLAMMKKCSKCGEIKSISAFHLDATMGDGRRSHCKSCRKVYSSEYWRRPEVKKSRSQRRRGWNKKHPRKRMITHTRRRARKAGIPFNLKYTDIVIPDICPALGIPLFRGNGRVCANSPTLDRIVPEIGYVRGNVIVVSHKANAMKNNATLEEMQRLVAFYEEIITDWRLGPVILRIKP